MFELVRVGPQPIAPWGREGGGLSIGISLAPAPGTLLAALGPHPPAWLWPQDTQTVLLPALPKALVGCPIRP